MIEIFWLLLLSWCFWEEAETLLFRSNQKSKLNGGNFLAEEVQKVLPIKANLLWFAGSKCFSSAVF